MDGCSDQGALRKRRRIQKRKIERGEIDIKCSSGLGAKDRIAMPLVAVELVVRGFAGQLVPPTEWENENENEAEGTLIAEGKHFQIGRKKVRAMYTHMTDGRTFSMVWEQDTCSNASP